jgi:phosphoribosylamine--glycine ligase
VLGVVETGTNLENAIARAYAQTEKVHFENAFFRHDIGARALLAKETGGK